MAKATKSNTAKSQEALTEESTLDNNAPETQEGQAPDTETGTQDAPVAQSAEDDAPETQEGQTPDAETETQDAPVAQSAEGDAPETQEGPTPGTATETQDAPVEQENDEDVEIIARYKKLYPQNKVFHMTSDKQVFLESGKRDAETHQKTLEGSGTLKSYHRHTI